jgi:hypothetical protein
MKSVSSDLYQMACKIFGIRGKPNKAKVFELLDFSVKETLKFKIDNVEIENSWKTNR